MRRGAEEMAEAGEVGAWMAEASGPEPETARTSADSAPKHNKKKEK